jgi:hypothetical protein
MSLLISLAFAAFLGLLPAMIANRKGRCFTDWWIYGAAFFILALPHALLLRPDPRPCVSRGVLLLATFQSRGFTHFGGTPGRFLASLASLLIFPVVGGVASAAAPEQGSPIGEIAAAICAMLLTPVLTWEFARWWRREQAWLRYATAANWCQWAVVAFTMLVVLVMPLLLGTSMGADSIGKAVVLVGAVLAYGLSLQWFLARRGLDISGWRAALLVLAVNAATALLVFGPRLLRGGWE